MRFLFPIFKICAIAALGSQKGREAGSEAGMDCGTALAKRARLRPCGEALRRRVFARPLAPVPARRGAEGGFARKPLKSPDSRKKETWSAPGDRRGA